jgi:molecular chaperone GrpE (heat shock protein)
LESIIKLTKTRNKKIEIDLKRRIQSVNDVNKTGATYSEALTKSIASLKRQIDNNNKFMKERYTEQENIRNSHNIDIERFKKLKKNKWLSE